MANAIAQAAQWADPNVDPWAWTQWAASQDPRTYDLTRYGITNDNLDAYKPQLQAAGLWNPAWDVGPGGVYEGGDSGTYTPVNNRDLSSLAGYQVSDTRAPGRGRIGALWDANGNPVGINNYRDEGSMHGKDWATAASVIGGAYLGATALGGAAGGASAAGAGAAAGSGGTAGAIANGAVMGGATGAGVGGASAAGIGGLAAGTGALYADAGNGTVSDAGTGGPSSATTATTASAPTTSTPAVDWNWGDTIKLLGSLGQSVAANKAAGQQAAATQAGIAEQARQYDTTRSDYAPWRTAGVDALGQLQAGIGKTPTAAEVMADPGYQFAQQQGEQALQRRAAASGGRLSGASLKALSDFNVGNATQGYNAAYQRGQDRLNRLQALAGLGQTATAGSAAAGMNKSNAITGLLSDQGNASAAATMAQGNIWGNALNSYVAGQNRRNRQPAYGYGGQAGWSSDPNADPYYMGD